MLQLGKGRNKASLGVDINPERIVLSYIKPNRLKNAKKQYKLESFVYKNIPDGLVSHGNINNPHEVGTLLKECIEENNLIGFTLNIAISGNLPFIKTLTVLDVPADELKIIIPQEAEKLLPFPVSDVNMDYMVLESTKRLEDNTHKVDILLIAVLKSIVKSYIDTTVVSNCYVKSVDISPLTLCRVMQASNMADTEYSVGALIGYDNTDIVIMHHGSPVFIHAVPLGKKDVTDSIASSLGLSTEETKELLPDVELLVAGGTEISANPKLVKAASTARSIFNNIASEIQKAIEFYSFQKGNLVDISKVYIAGSGVCIGNVDVFIANRLKITTEIFNPYLNIDLPDSIDLLTPSEVVSSIGLALKGIV